MQPQLVFSFPVTISAHDAIKAVADHFAVSVSIGDGPATVPMHVKQAVESIGTDNPANGVEQSPAIAFGGLVNGTPNVAPSSVVAALPPTAPVVTLATPATLPGASSAPVLPTANTGAVAPVASAEQVNPAASVDSSGLPWDERIHSSKRTQNPDGTWRKRKGVTPPIVAKVEAELRSGGNVAATATATAANSAASTAASLNSPEPSMDRKAEAIAYADREALRVAGEPSPIAAAVLVDLLNNKTHTLTPVQADWFAIYYAKRNAAYVEFMSGNVVPAVPASVTPTGNTPAAAPVPPAPATSPATAVTPPPVSGVELDATGLPHDTRINVGAKIKDTAGVWVQRHDVDPATKLQVMAELRAQLAGNVAVNASATPVGASSPVAAPAPAVPVITVDEARGNFAKMMQWIVANTAAQRITQSDAVEAATMLGFPNLAALAQQQPYLTYVVDALIQKGAQ